MGNPTSSVKIPPMKSSIFSFLCVLVLSSLLHLPSQSALGATMPAVQMKIVDAQTGSPIGGANVLFQATAHQGTFTGHGGKTAILFVMEAVSDEAGAIRFPEKEFSAYPFFLNTNYENPTMVIVKDGYEPLILQGTSHIIPTRKEITVWQYNTQSVQMKLPKADADPKILYSVVARMAEMPVGEKTPCAWKSYPQFLAALELWNAKVNPKKPVPAFPPMIPIDRSAGLAFWGLGSPLEKILSQEEFFVKEGCGSPKTFFHAYFR